MFWKVSCATKNGLATKSGNCYEKWPVLQKVACGLFYEKWPMLREFSCATESGMCYENWYVLCKVTSAKNSCDTSGLRHDK